jgi:hypothetical protein
MHSLFQRINVSIRSNMAKVSPDMLVSGAPICHGVCRQMLPAVYRFVGASFHAGPSALGELTLARALLQALASPFGGLAGLATRCIPMLAYREKFCRRWPNSSAGTAFVRLLLLQRRAPLRQSLGDCRRLHPVGTHGSQLLHHLIRVSAQPLALGSDGCRLGPDRAKCAKHHRRSAASSLHTVTADSGCFDGLRNTVPATTGL